MKKGVDRLRHLREAVPVAWANIPPKRNRSDPICFSPISTALATGSSGSSTGSNNVVGWPRAMTGLLPTSLPSFSSVNHAAAPP